MSYSCHFNTEANKSSGARTFYFFPNEDGLRTCMQPKICFLTLETTWGKILALDQVQKRGLALVCRCYLCQECEKSMNHPPSPLLYQDEDFMGTTFLSF